MSDKQATVTATPLLRRHLAGSLVAELRRQIETGQLSVGARMPTERALCEAFGVGRTTVREALAALEAARLIERRGRWLHVASPLPEPVGALEGIRPDEWIDVRRLVGVRCAEVAADEAKRSDLARLQLILDRLDEALDDPMAFAEADRDFHLAVVRATHHAGLIALVDGCQELLFGSGRGSPARPVPVSSRWHHQVFRGIQARRPNVAGAAMFHLLDVLERTVMARRDGPVTAAANPVQDTNRMKER